MTDQNSQFFAILTAVGEAKQANANAIGVPWTFAHMGVGDANMTDPVPDRAQTRLINEKRRAPLNQLKVDPSNPNIIIAEQVIPPDVGGWWIRELGLYDAAGDLVAVANCAPSFKPLLTQGTGKTQVVRLHLIVTSTANVQLKIDPAVVLATRDYVDSSILNVLPRNKVAGSYTKVLINERGIVQQGYNPTTLAGYGITDALPILNPLAAGSLDLHGGPFAFVSSLSESSVCQNCYYNGTSWMRKDITKAAICIAASDGALTVRRVGPGANPIAWATTGEALDTVNLKFSHLQQLPATVAAHGITDVYTKPETQQRIDAAIAALVGSAPGALDKLDELAAALNNDPAFAATMINQLATKANKATTLAGYGITDGLPILNPLAAGSLDLHGGPFAFVSSLSESSVCQNCYYNGTSWMRKDITKAAICIAASGGALTVRRVGAGANPIAWATTGEVLDTVNLKFSHLQQLPATVAAHGITDVYTKPETQQRIDAAIAALVGSAPGALDKLDELAAALNNDPAFAATMINQLATKANKATTLAGYGITDALPNLNPLPGGSYDVHGGSYAFLTSTSESTVAQNIHWTGATWVKRIVDNPAAALTVSAGSVVVRKWAAGVAGGNAPEVYEVVDMGMRASNEEVDTGSASAKWVSVAGMARFFARLVKQATEGFAGVAAIGTLAQVQAGADDAVIVTPKKLRWGVAFSFTQNGYLVFPAWMGSFVLQWGYIYESQSATDYRAFPIPFPTQCLGMTITMDAATTGGFSGNNALVTQVIDRTRFLWSVAGTLSGGGYGYMWAWGN